MHLSQYGNFSMRFKGRLRARMRFCGSCVGCWQRCVGGSRCALRQDVGVCAHLCTDGAAPDACMGRVDLVNHATTAGLLPVMYATMSFQLVLPQTTCLTRAAGGSPSIASSAAAAAASAGASAAAAAAGEGNACNLQFVTAD